MSNGRTENRSTSQTRTSLTSYSDASLLPREMKWEPISEDWKSNLKGMKWSPYYVGAESFSKELAAVRDRVLEYGGEMVVLPDFEEDAERLLKRGQFWYGDEKYVLREGRPSQCHWNSATLKDKSPEQFDIVTGYALSPDGAWRQHTWLIEHRKDGDYICETTVPRIGYFGYVLTEEEAQEFIESNW